MIVPLILIAVAAAFAGGTAPICDPERLNCDNGTRGGGMAQAAKAAPGISNNPGGLTGGGQVGSPGKSPGKGGHKGHGKSKGKK